MSAPRRSSRSRATASATEFEALRAEPAHQVFTSFGTFIDSLSVPAVERDVNPDVAYFLDPTSIEFVMAGPPTVVVGD